MTPLARLPLLLLALLTLTAALPAPVAAEGENDTLVLRGPRVGDAFTFRWYDPDGEASSFTLRYRWVGTDVIRDPFDQPLPTVVLVEEMSSCYDDWGCSESVMEYHVDPATTSIVSRSQHTDDRYGLYVFSEPFLLGQPVVSDFESRISRVAAWISAMGRAWVKDEVFTVASRMDADGVAETVSIVARGMEGPRYVLDDGSRHLHYDGVSPWPSSITFPDASGWSYRVEESIEGTDPLPWRIGDATPARTTWPDAERAEYTVDGPAETFIARWPLAEATHRARQNGAVATWMKAHPDAYLVEATGRDDTRTVLWSLVYAEGSALLRVGLEHSRQSYDPHAPTFTVQEDVAAVAFPDKSEVVGRSFACDEHSRQFTEERLLDGLAQSIHKRVSSRVVPHLRDVLCEAEIAHEHTEVGTDGIAVRNRYASEASAMVFGASGGIVGLTSKQRYDRVGL